MQRRYRRAGKRRVVLSKNIRVLSAAAILTLGILSVIPQGYLYGMLAKGIGAREPDIVDYAVHINTPKLSLAERLIFPRLFCYARQIQLSGGGGTLAVSGTAVLTTDGEEASGDTASQSDGVTASGDAASQVDGEDTSGNAASQSDGETISGSTALQTTAGAETESDDTVTESNGETETDGSENGGSLRFLVDTQAQAGLLQENVYDNGTQDDDSRTDTDQTADNQTNGQTASRLTVFDEITGQSQANSFSPVQQKYYNLSDFDSFEALIEEFYVVDASTQPTASLINLTSLTSYDCTISKEDAAPQILIYHSHSQETYADSDENDPSTTIVGVGERLAELLEEYGYSVLHHEGTYDVPSRDDAYSNALPAIEALLEEYPSIEVVIDLHRDAVAEGTKLVYTYEGKDYARFMFFNGISRTAYGPIEYLFNENLEANLAFSFQAQVVTESYFPGITRGIYLKAWRYNMHLMPKYMLIELGAQTNTVEEAMNTCEVLAFVLDQVLSGGE
ncbi:MAG: stage II sporulation protein P [Lachnospiraceae bacterium]|nr:stage II sporulation protein P [Lachnospiraceae bacterium]